LRVRPRPVGWLSVLLVLVLLVLVLLSTALLRGVRRGKASRSGPVVYFGTLQSQPDRAATEASAGVSVAMLELSWRQYEPEAGRRDPVYLRRTQEALQEFRSAGLRVTLALGLHDPPGWVLDLPDSRYVDQDGNVSAEPNLVFNQELRDLAAGYLRQVIQDLGPRTFWAVRLTSGGSAEVLYPPGGSFWAFDRHALGGPALPRTMPPNPVRGFRPGSQPVDPAAAEAFAVWYVSALDDVLVWQRQTLRALGFRGRYYVLTPGRGVRPTEFDEAVEAGLPNGLLGTGAVWDRLYAGLPPTGDWVAYVSSVADGSGEDDVCRPSDATVPLDDPRVLQWSATRWISRIAAAGGLGLSGENSGLEDSRGADYRDTSSDGMLARAGRQVVSCGLEGLYWAHDAQLWDGTLPFDAFARMVGDIRSEAAPMPAGQGLTRTRGRRCTR
jgi:hypothetical protein